MADKPELTDEELAAIVERLERPEAISVATALRLAREVQRGRLRAVEMKDALVMIETAATAMAGERNSEEEQVAPTPADVLLDAMADIRDWAREGLKGEAGVASDEVRDG